MLRAKSSAMVIIYRSRQLAKTPKSKLLEIIEKNIPPAETVSADSVWMIDAINLLQAISSAPEKFRYVAKKISLFHHTMPYN